MTFIDPTKVQVSTQTKAIFNLCVDAQVEHRIASSVDVGYVNSFFR